MPLNQPYPARNYALGAYLLTLRNRTKLTQAELAARIGVHRRSIQKWESGANYPTAENLRALIELLLTVGVFPPGEERPAVVDLWQRVSQGAPQQFPLLDTAWLDQRLAAPLRLPVNAPPAAQPPVPTLPVQATPLLGREADLHALAKLLADPACRLLTLFGPGGIGKSRLALAIAARQAPLFRDGVLFVDLTAVDTPDQLVAAIGDALHLTLAGPVPTGDNPTTHLLGYLRDRQLLLLLDDFAHLVAGADLVSAIGAHAPQVTMLITSRARLNLPRERVFDVEGLAYPAVDLLGAVAAETVTALAGYSAVQLFVQRARQLQPGFPLSETTLTAVGRICQQVAGLPLAIELAAASVPSLPIAEIEGQIRANLAGLATTLRDVPARHRSLRAVFDHSWALLSEAEQVVLSRLAIFRGGWDQAAAEAICAYIAQQLEKAATDARTLPFFSVTFAPPLLAALIDKSFVRTAPELARPSSMQLPDAHVAPEPRFVLLEPIRDYALAKLAARGEAPLLQRAHALYYLEVAAAAVAQWVSPPVDTAMAQLDRERDNLRAALQWARDGGDLLIGLQLAATLVKFWRQRGAVSEGRRWLEELLAQNVPPADGAATALRLRAVQGAAWLASDQHDYARATVLFEEGMHLRRALGEREDETQLLVNQALAARTAGQYLRATQLLEDVLFQQRALDNRGTLSNSGVGLTLFLLGLVQREQGNFARARQLFDEHLRLHRALGDQEGVAVGLLALSDLARDQGDGAAIRQYSAESLPILRSLAVRWAIGFALNNLALAAYWMDDLPQAVTLINESVAIYQAQQAEGSLAEVLITQGKIIAAQGELAAAHLILVEALRCAWQVGPRLFVAAALETLATVALDAAAEPRRPLLAVQWLAAATTLRTDLRTPAPPVVQRAIDQLQATLRTTLGAAQFAASWAQGSTLPLEQILRTIPGVTPWLTNRTQVAPPNVPAPAHSAGPSRQPQIDWGLAQDVPILYGRVHELAMLTQWALTEECRVITIAGMGGIGKTSLAVTFGRQVAAHFTTVIFRSLGEAPPLAELLAQVNRRLATGHEETQRQLALQPALAGVSRTEQTLLLIQLLRQQRVLLILDNLESLMQVGTTQAQYLAGYEGYGALFKALGETAHQSCVILTSRERPPELAALEGTRAPVRTLPLTGLAEAACIALLADQDLLGNAEGAALLAQRYGGNPLALRLVTDPIRALFQGDIAAFLREGNLFFNGVGHLLAQQIDRAATLERALLTWLTIARTPITLDELMAALAGSPTVSNALGVTRTAVLAALHALWRRNLIELGQTHLAFTLQRVVLEYLTEQLVVFCKISLDR